MIKVGVQLHGENGDPLPWETHALARVPSIGEHVGHVMGEGTPPGPFRVVRVVHFFQPGDDGRMAEIVAVKESATA